MLKLNGYLPMILIVAGMLFTGMASYYANQVGIASAMGDRPTRQEMKETVEQYHETVKRELDTIKESQKETREDMRAIRRYMDEQAINRAARAAPHTEENR